MVSGTLAAMLGLEVLPCIEELARDLTANTVLPSLSNTDRL
jgi:hypothetical protein